jgi:hypothetical protein
MAHSIFYEAVRQVVCPKCKAPLLHPCKQPSGRKAYPPHRERQAVLIEKTGIEPYSGKGTPTDDIIQHWKGLP